jgi:hypothetical protein
MDNTIQKVFGPTDETTFVSTVALLSLASASVSADSNHGISTNTNNNKQQQQLIVALWNRESSTRAFQAVIPTMNNSHCMSKASP